MNNFRICFLLPIFIFGSCNSEEKIPKSVELGEEFQVKSDGLVVADMRGMANEVTIYAEGKNGEMVKITRDKRTGSFTEIQILTIDEAGQSQGYYLTEDRSLEKVKNEEGELPDNK